MTVSAPAVNGTDAGTSVRRKRPIRADGLVPVECPHCGQLYFYVAPHTSGAIEIKCERRTCGRIEMVYINQATEVVR